MVTIVGLPFLNNFKLYNVAAVVFNGTLLGLVPKQHIPNYSEFYEARHFAVGPKEVSYIDIPELGYELEDSGSFVSFGANLLFKMCIRDRTCAGWLYDRRRCKSIECKEI